MNETDRQRGERLSREIFEVDTEPYDPSLAQATRRFGRAMAKKGAEDWLAAGADLAEYLISERPLGPAERRQLALMVLGELRHTPTKLPLTACSPKVAKVVSRLRQLEREFAESSRMVKKEEIVKKVAREFGMGASTIAKYEKLVRDHEEIVAEVVAECDRIF